VLQAFLDDVGSARPAPAAAAELVTKYTLLARAAELNRRGARLDYR
jgi:hypothetical protein